MRPVYAVQLEIRLPDPGDLGQLQTFLADLAAGAGETKTTEERRAAYRAEIPGYVEEIREADRRLAVPETPAGPTRA